jgi:hypothetical protein
MNQSKTDLGIVNESQLLRFGISTRPVKQLRDDECCHIEKEQGSASD